jgi:Protein kinase domain
VAKRPSRPSHSATGDLLEKRGYRLEREIGSGGLGVVYRATTVSDGSPVALKVLPSSIAAIDETALELPQHEGLIQILDRGVLPNGSGFIVMPLLGGGSLADLLRDGPLPSGFVGHVGFRIAGALHALHSSGLVHGDVTPANILFTDGGGPVLADLGLAQSVHAGVAVPALGFTMAYVSPEVLTASALTPMSDIFSLGATLFAACTGRPPWLQARFAAGQTVVGVQDAQFAEDAGDFSARIQSELSARAVDHSLSRVIVAALSHDPSDRLDASTMSEALAAYAPQGEAVAVGGVTLHRPVLHADEFTASSALGVLLNSADAVLDQITFTRLVGDEGEELRPVSFRIQVADRADAARLRSAVRGSFVVTSLGTGVAALSFFVAVWSELPDSWLQKGLLVGGTAVGVMVPTVLTAGFGVVRRRWESSRGINVKRSRVKVQAAFVQAIRDAALTGGYTK